MSIFDFSEMGQVTLTSPNEAKTSGAVSDPVREWSMKANQFLATYEMFQRDFVGFQFSADFGNLFLRLFPETGREETVTIDEKVLVARISMLNRDPGFILNRLCYPMAFKNVYPSAGFRPFVIDEHEKMLASVLAIQSGNRDSFDVQEYWPKDPNKPIAVFLKNLAEAYEGEYRFEDSLKIAQELFRRNLLHWFPCERLFWKMGLSEQGIELFKHLEDTTKGAPMKNHWRLCTNELMRLKDKKYSPKPVKKSAMPVENIFKFNGH